MRSDRGGRPEVEAFRELQRLVKHLGGELSGFRKRALEAEAKLKQFESAMGSSKPTPERLAALERDNRELKKRLNQATGDARELVERVRFLKEQQQTAGSGSR